MYAGKLRLFDNLVGEREEIVGQIEAKRLGDLELHDRFKPAWRLHRQVGLFLALQDADYIEPTL